MMFDRMSMQERRGLGEAAWQQRMREFGTAPHLRRVLHVLLMRDEIGNQVNTVVNTI